MSYAKLIAEARQNIYYMNHSADADEDDIEMMNRLVAALETAEMRRAQ